MSKTFLCFIYALKNTQNHLGEVLEKCHLFITCSIIPVKVYKITQLQVLLIFYIIFKWFEVAKFKNINYNH